jgi:hypothetical protein
MKEFDSEILNAALEIATEWDDNFRKPIADRMLSTFPQLTADEIAEIEQIVKAAEYFIYELAEQELEGKITEADIIPAAVGKIGWIDRAHVLRLKNIGMYYARR